MCQLGQYESIPTHMLWNETDLQQVLSMACANGTLLNIEGRDKIVPTETSAKNKMATADDGINNNNSNMGKEQEDPPQPASAPGRKRIAKNHVDNADSEDDIDFGDENVTSSSETKKTVSFVADEAEEDNDDEEEPQAREKEKESDSISAGEDIDLQDDDDFDFNRATPLTTPISQLPDPQPPFAPSATPLDQARRIMCWNQIGTISYLRDDDGMTRNTVDIDFSDSATRRPVSFTDNMNFILGSIGEDGAIFASDLTDDDHDDNDDDADELNGLNISKRTKDLVRRSQNKRDGMKSTGSNVYFHRFETFGSLRDKDWLLTLPDGERAVGCACGEGWAAVITRFVPRCFR